MVARCFRFGYCKLVSRHIEWSFTSILCRLDLNEPFGSRRFEREDVEPDSISLGLRCVLDLPSKILFAKTDQPFALIVQDKDLTRSTKRAISRFSL